MYRAWGARTLTSQGLLHGHLQAALLNRLVDVRSQVRQDLEGQVSQWSRLLLQKPSRIALRKADTEMCPHTLEEPNLPRLTAIIPRRRLRKRIQMPDQTRHILIPTIRLKPQLMLQGNRKRRDQIHPRHLPQQILLPQLRILLIIPPLITMHPDDPAETLRRKDKLGPVLAAVVVALVGRGGAEGETQGHDETHDGEEEVGDAQVVHELGDAGYEGGPDADPDEGEDHLGEDGAVHAHEGGPFGVFAHVAGAGLCVSLVSTPHNLRDGEIARSSHQHPSSSVHD